MTDVTGATDGGNPNPNPAAGADGLDPDGGTNPFAELGLEPATLEWVGKRHSNDIAALAKQAHELDQFAGRAVAVPKDDADQEDWDKFYKRLGRPDEATGYDLLVPNLPDTSPYDADLANAFREKAFELGISQDAAAGLHEWMAETVGEMSTQVQGTVAEQLQGTIDDANEKLQAAWGEPDTETFKANLEMAGRFFEAVDEDGALMDKLSDVGLMGDNGEILVAELALAFAKAGVAIFTEGSTLSEGGGLSGVNPFDGEGNLTAIMQLVKGDPDQARLLAKAGGKDPADYGL